MKNIVRRKWRSPLSRRLVTAPTVTPRRAPRQSNADDGAKLVHRNGPRFPLGLRPLLPIRISRTSVPQWAFTYRPSALRSEGGREALGKRTGRALRRPQRGARRTGANARCPETMRRLSLTFTSTSCAHAGHIQQEQDSRSLSQIDIGGSPTPHPASSVRAAPSISMQPVDLLLHIFRGILLHPESAR